MRTDISVLKKRKEKLRMINLDYYYDLVWDNVLTPAWKIDKEVFRIAIEELKEKQCNYVREVGIDEYVIRIQEFISQLSIMLKEATKEDYTNDLEILIYVLGINYNQGFLEEHKHLINKDLKKSYK